MGTETKIVWCHHTYNDWIGCTRVSEGCANCYGETLAKRYRWAEWGPGKPRRMKSENTRGELERWDRAARKRGVRERVFVMSLADWADTEVPDAVRDVLFDRLDALTNLDVLLLTKRINDAAVYLRVRYAGRQIPAHFWMGVTVENQARADERISRLLELKRELGISIAWLSMEPLLEAVSLESILYPQPGEPRHRVDVIRGGYWNAKGVVACGPSAGLGELRGGFTNHSGMATIDWIVVGGESGAKTRPFDMQWARDLRDECASAATRFFFKQAGSKPRSLIDAVGDRSEADLELPNNAWVNHPMDCVEWEFKHRAGADPSEWPGDLRVQQFPACASAPTPEARP